jgi:hypothetical protein
MRWPVVLALLLAARAADAQELPVLNEKVYIVADSGQWVLVYHTLPETGTEACEVATREQPGAIFKYSVQGHRSFTLYLLWSSATIDSFVLQVDAKRPVVRKPSYEERTKNVLHVRGSDLGGHIDRLVGASRLRVQVFYPGREKQDLEIDLTGFTPLYWRAIQFDCVPLQIIEAASCQSLRKRFSDKLSVLPFFCRQSQEPKRRRGLQPPM